MCPLARSRTHSVPGEGNPHAELMFVGEAPGSNEDMQGRPFVGRAGQLLDRMIAAMGYAREDVFICNVCKCRPPNNRKPTFDEMAACVPFLHQQIAAVRPRCIVTLGATAFEGLFSRVAPVGITRLRGTWHHYHETPVMPTFHPAYVLRSPDKKRPVWEDLQAVMKLLGRPIPARPADGQRDATATTAT